MKRKYVPIDDRGYRIPVSGWTRKDYVTFDGALPPSALDENDPEGTNSARPVQGAQSANKPMHKVTGGITNNYFPNDPAKMTISTSCPTRWSRACWTTPESAAARMLHMRLRGQAQDADRPPDNVSGGQPQRGGGMTTLKAGRQTIMNEQKAMDSRVGSFKDRWPEVARITGIASSKRDRVPAQLALDTAKRRVGGKSFSERYPEVSRIKVL